VPAWMSLLYRERADIQCSDQAAYKSDLHSANQWARVACEAARKGDTARVPAQWPPAPPPPVSKHSCGD
jgi:hypothetical protein